MRETVTLAPPNSLILVMDPFTALAPLGAALFLLLRVPYDLHVDKLLKL